MTVTGRIRTAPLRVIEGAGRSPGHGADLPAPPAPRLCHRELAAEMAEIFALSLLREHALTELDDPHRALRLDGSTRISLQDLLCELRSLSWYASREGAADTGLPAHRRALRLNADRQLTLRGLLRAGVALEGRSAVLSAFWRNDTAAATPDPQPVPPDAHASPAAWVTWCARQSGAGLQDPGRPVTAPPADSLGAMAAALHDMPPARPFHNAALAALEDGIPLSEGIAGTDPAWRTGEVLSLMAEAERRTRQVVLAQAMQPDRTPRPAVIAARMTLWLASEERGGAEARGGHRAAAETLAQETPELLAWVSRVNTRLRGRQRFETSLFLPLADPDEQHHGAADLICHVAVAGALATLLKAVFGGGVSSTIPEDATQAARTLRVEADRMAANIALARLVSGGFLPAENHQHLRLGEAIALQVLRERLEARNCGATLLLRDFDGRDLRLTSCARPFGRGAAQLRINDMPSPWPVTGARARARRAAHLTAVI